MYSKYIRKCIEMSTTLFTLAIIAIAIASIYTVSEWSIGRAVKAYNSIYSTPQAISLKERERQLACLTQNIYWEAASEPFEGKVAVAQVTLNRASDANFPNDVCKVVYQRNIVYNKIICQFSWFCESNFKVKPIHKPMFEESEAVAKKVLLEGFRLDGLKDALYYHADYVNPKWNKEKVAVIGHHIFYR